MTPTEAEDWVLQTARVTQRFTFDRVAGTYDAIRPGYPAELFDGIAAFADLQPGDRLLEIGCGSGQATAGLAAWGLPLLALDPGVDLLALARRNLAAASHVGFQQATFEAWPPEPDAYRLVASAQAIHWVAPELRFAKAAAVLSPGGTLAVWGNVPVDAPAEVKAAIAAAYQAHAPELLGLTAPETWYLADGPVGEQIAQTPGFGPVEHRSYAWAVSFDGAGYRELMQTKSYHQVLPPERRAALFSAIQSEIDAVCERFDLAYETHLYLARKRR